MNHNETPTPRSVHFADSAEVHEYTPDASPIPTPVRMRTPLGDGTASFPPVPNPVLQPGNGIQYMAPQAVPGYAPPTVFIPPGYMLVGSQPSPLAHYHVPAPAPAPAPVPIAANPTIHPCLAHLPVQWDVRTTMHPPGLTHDRAYEAAFSPNLTSVTLRFTTPQGIRFTHTIGGLGLGGGRPLHVADVLGAIHDALYTPAVVPRERAGTLRTAEMARGYRSLRRDEHLYRVDLYPVSPHHADGAKLFLLGLEWGEGRGEVRVLLGDGTWVA